MALRTNVVMKGLSDVKQELKRASRRARNAGAVGLYAVAVQIMKQAKEFTPVESGALRASGYVTMPDGESRNIEIGFGGPAAAYAEIQHENEDYNHTVGQAHYFLAALEQVLAVRGTATFARYAQEAFDRGNAIVKQVPETPWEDQK